MLNSRFRVLAICATGMLVPVSISAFDVPPSPSIILTCQPQPAAVEETNPPEVVEEEPTPTHPVAIIKGPTKGVPGDILVLDASSSERAQHWAWDVKTSAVTPKSGGADVEKIITALEEEGYQITRKAEPVFDKSYIISADDKKLILASHPGVEYDVVLGVSNDEGISIVRWSVKIGCNCPDDDPDVPDDPDDPEPQDPFDLFDEARQWKSEVQHHRDKLKYLGKAIQQVGVRAGELGTIQAVDKMITLTLVDQFGAEAQDWADLYEAVDKALAKIRRQASLTQYGQALDTLGRGLQ